MGWLGAPRVQGAGFATGIVAVLAMIVVGCTHVTDGDVAVAGGEAPLYRASVSASIEESVASSSARESERQESLTREAVQTSCEVMSSSSADAIGAVNAYVEAFNSNSVDIGRNAGPAVDALNLSADQVAGSISDPLAPDLRDKLNSWVEAARVVATAIAGNYGTDEFNAAITRLNDSKTAALDRCDAAYR
ncbi:hypothetical protein NGTWS0302_23330 [Mycolicibacterium cyprinidarum]|uniref:Lipoprotein n=1 Tax=Mycolicibacterium cyprinidarum TaxID=2860311 RepID=A0ABQ4V7M6_9MYCO|nr:hypothetical protein NGTWS0302_23330 [Mycolicibacterium sp. NGTWS0302]GJF10766.1 hypothetical protein NGTWS1702_07000 [Mycolicibacterium sp. NGTWSNA01]GJF18283.1 hypothetical protein NGTWS1803_37230 [Mycolicibacterium sp. NGTWS1803]